MTKHDTIIAGLVNALDAIAREATKNEQYFIVGVAQQAIANARVHQERNRDGYFVVKVS